jgi:hypothetical protein
MSGIEPMLAAGAVKALPVVSQAAKNLVTSSAKSGAVKYYRSTTGKASDRLTNNNNDLFLCLLLSLYQFISELTLRDQDSVWNKKQMDTGKNLLRNIAKIISSDQYISVCNNISKTQGTDFIDVFDKFKKNKEENCFNHRMITDQNILDISKIVGNNFTLDGDIDEILRTKNRPDLVDILPDFDKEIVSADNEHVYITQLRKMSLGRGGDKKLTDEARRQGVPETTITDFTRNKDTEKFIRTIYSTRFQLPGSEGGGIKRKRKSFKKKRKSFKKKRKTIKRNKKTYKKK